MISVVAHWTTYEYKTETTLIAIREIHGVHTGDTIANTLFEAAKEFNIHNNFRYFVPEVNSSTIIVFHSIEIFKHVLPNCFC